MERLENSLTSALTQRHCPVCFVLEEKTYDLLCQLQHEAAQIEEIRESVIRAGGYCHFHFWYLHRLSSPVTNAQLLEGSLERIRADLLDGQDNSERVPAPVLARIGCPVCCSSSKWEDELVAVFTVKIQEEAFRRAYQSSRGLCLPHFSRVLRRLPDKEIQASLFAVTCSQLDVLIQELRLQVTKWRNKDRSPGEEQDSSFRAIEKLVGGKNFRTGVGASELDLGREDPPVRPRRSSS